MGKVGEQGPAGTTERPLFRGPFRGPPPSTEASRQSTTVPSAQMVTPPLGGAMFQSPGLGSCL